MRSLPPLLAALSAFFAPGSVEAQIATPSSFGAGIYTGGSLPVGHFRNTTQPGYHIGGTIDLASSNLFGPRLDVAFNKFSDKPTAFGEVGTNLLFGTLGAELKPGANSPAPAGRKIVSPFLLAGAGVYRIRFDIVRTRPGGTEPPRETQSDIHFGLNLAGGADLPVYSLRTFAQVGYHTLFPKRGQDGNTSMFLASVGLHF